MLVTAPNGLESGLDFTVFGGYVHEIPSSKYSLGPGLGGDDRLITRRLDIGAPAAGRYLVQVVGGSAGPLALKFTGTDENGGTTVRDFRGSTWPGHTVIYVIHYSPVPGAKFNVTRLAPFDDFCANVNTPSLPPPSSRVVATFTLGSRSKGVNPPTQAVFFQFSSYAATIPTGSFKRTGRGNFSFDGTIQNVALKVEILQEGPRKYALDLKASGGGLYFSQRPIQLLLILGNNAGVARFNIFPCCGCRRGQTQALTKAQKLVQQFKCEPEFWKQFGIGEKIVALRDKSVLTELRPSLYPPDSLYPATEDELLTEENVAFVFASLGDDSGFRIIKEMLENRSNRRQVRYYAAHLFGDLKDPRAVPILIPYLTDRAVNYIVPWSLGQIGDKRAIPPLIRTLNDKNPDMRVLAIYALEQLGAKQALPEIRALLSDHQRIHFDGLIAVSAAAQEAINKLEQKP